MANELVAQMDPGTFFRESSTGYDLVTLSALTGNLRGLTLPKMNPGKASGTPAVPYEYLTFTTTIPANLTMATGLTFYLHLTDDGLDANDLGKVVKFGIVVKRLIADETTDLTAAAGTEQTGTVTLSATTAGVAIFSKAIAAANLDSAAVGDLIAIRIRRMGDDSADTCNGRVILLSGHIKNT